MILAALPETAKAKLTSLQLARLASEEKQRAARLQNAWRVR
jgi:hypothetical protein